MSRSCWPESSRTLATNKTSDTPILSPGRPARSFRLASLEPPMVRKGNHETLCTFPYGPHRDRNGVRDHCGNAAINNYICESGESVHDSAYPASAYAAVTTGARSAKTSVAGTAARERGGPFHPHANYAAAAAHSTAAATAAAAAKASAAYPNSSESGDYAAYPAAAYATAATAAHSASRMIDSSRSSGLSCAEIQISYPEGPNERNDHQAAPSKMRRLNCSGSMQLAVGSMGRFISAGNTSESHVSRLRDRAHCATFAFSSLFGQRRKVSPLYGSNDAFTTI